MTNQKLKMRTGYADINKRRNIVYWTLNCRSIGIKENVESVLRRYSIDTSVCPKKIQTSPYNRLWRPIGL
jgi:hypothetical protein